MDVIDTYTIRPLRFWLNYIFVVAIVGCWCCIEVAVKQTWGLHSAIEVLFERQLAGLEKCSVVLAFLGTCLSQVVLYHLSIHGYFVDPFDYCAKEFDFEHEMWTHTLRLPVGWNNIDMLAILYLCVWSYPLWPQSGENNVPVPVDFISLRADQLLKFHSTWPSLCFIHFAIGDVHICGLVVLFLGLNCSGTNSKVVQDPHRRNDHDSGSKIYYFPKLIEPVEKLGALQLIQDCGYDMELSALVYSSSYEIAWGRAESSWYQYNFSTGHDQDMLIHAVWVFKRIYDESPAGVHVLPGITVVWLAGVDSDLLSTKSKERQFIVNITWKKKTKVSLLQKTNLWMFMLQALKMTLIEIWEVFRLLGKTVLVLQVFSQIWSPSCSFWLCWKICTC